MDELQVLKQRVAALEQKPLITHMHTGTDMNRVFWRDLAEKKVFIHHTIVGADAATGANYSFFWIAPYKGYVKSFREVHQTAGTDGGTVTVTLEKLTGTQAPDAGTVLLSSALSLKATANTVQTGTLVTAVSSLNFDTGDRLCLKDSGTLTSVANVSVLVEVIII